MRKFVYSIPVILICFTFTNCEKCVENQLAILKFTPEELNINPYTGNEILTFKNLAGDSVIFPSGIRKTEVHEVHRYDSETAKVDHNGCAGDYFYADYNWMEKITDSSNSCLDIKMGFLYTIEKPTTDKEILLRFFSLIKTQPGGCVFWGYYKFETDTLYNNPCYGDSIVSYHYYLSIGPKAFNNIYELYCQNPGSNQEWFSIAYYSIKEGLVGFKTNFGQIWYLDKKSI